MHTYALFSLFVSSSIVILPLRLNGLVWIQRLHLIAKKQSETNQTCHVFLILGIIFFTELTHAAQTELTELWHKTKP